MPTATANPDATKYVYAFGKQTDGDAKMKALLGGKGANLAEMAAIGLPVPPGFTITTEVCAFYYANGHTYPLSLQAEVRAAVQAVEFQVGKKFGDRDNPLTFSVRSGARESMPGMMDTILNLGLSDATVEALAKKTGNPRFAYDCYRRFVQMYGDVVMGVRARNESEHDPFEHAMHTFKERIGVHDDLDLTGDHFKELVSIFKGLIRERTGTSFPEDVYEQLWGAVGAVFKSWQNERAILYRQKYNIPAEWGTAVNVQAMVFGNSGNNSATGVAFTRDPANGQKVFYGEYLINAQGEDVVAGIRTPKPIAMLEKEMPTSYAELDAVRQKLEKHFKDMQDLEFTVEDGKLYMLQTRNGKRTGLAAVKIAYDMVQEGLIDQKAAVKRIPADSVSSLLVPIFDEKARKNTKVLAKGLPAGPGAASGQLVFTAATAERNAQKGVKSVLCRVETSPEDLRGMLASEGILTSRGGVSSHAALVARQLGKVCVCGAHELQIDYGARTLRVKDTVLHEGDYISIDGTLGEIYAGHVDTAPSEVQQVLNGSLPANQSQTYHMYNEIMKWADGIRRLKVRTNVDDPVNARKAVAFGAEGIGLCRTEHMFFEGERIYHMREMIMASDSHERRRALAKLLPHQRKDFAGLFEAMEGRPVTIRLLDPPLHEFLPHDDATRRDTADRLGLAPEYVSRRVNELHEQNPMLGHRGCRLGITYPEITEMQAQAICEAAVECIQKGIKVDVEIMVPLVGFTKELEHQVNVIHQTAKEVMAKSGVNFSYLVGTMVEVPRAALRAGEIAKVAQFFSFGTNDLTQTTLGMSRDDSAPFLTAYKDLDILGQNPFETIDKDGVGELVKIATERGRATRTDLKVGICGEHGGEPNSVKFCHHVGLNYVSCSPPRVPIARLAAAQAALEG